MSLGYQAGLWCVHTGGHLMEVRAPRGSCEHQNTQKQNPYKPEDWPGIMQERSETTLPMEYLN
jgi:hypothetical protein